MIEVEKHRVFVSREENLARYRREKARVELMEILKKKLIEKAMDDLSRSGVLDAVLLDIAEKRLDPYSVADKVVDHRFAFPLGEKSGKGKGSRGRRK